MQVPTPFAVPRVDTRPEPHPDSLVRLGDVVKVVSKQVESHVETVSWSQEHRPMNESYYVISAMFQNPRENDELPIQVPIYVHMSLKDVFLDMCSHDDDSGTCSLTINRHFRYGQNTEKTRRFLVLHDRNFTPFQHRFMDSNALAILLKTGQETATAVAGPAAEYIPYGSLLLKAGEGTSQAMKMAFGDQLWIFDDGSS